MTTIVVIHCFGLWNSSTHRRQIQIRLKNHSIRSMFNVAKSDLDKINQVANKPRPHSPIVLNSNHNVLILYSPNMMRNVVLFMQMIVILPETSVPCSISS